MIMEWWLATVLIGGAYNPVQPFPSYEQCQTTAHHRMYEYRRMGIPGQEFACVPMRARIYPNQMYRPPAHVYSQPPYRVYPPYPPYRHHDIYIHIERRR